MGNHEQKAGKVYLTGAGPGDPKLLTLRAAEVLRACDVIVYDALVNTEILRHAPPEAELIFAGKRGGRPSISQAEIHRLLVDRARKGMIVVRLKGGDPFIFGRGGEEAEALAAAGIDWEVAPGVSSGIAAADYAGIPLTHRGYSSSVAFVSGHDIPGADRRPPDWAALAHSAGTLVIFMCAHTIGSIAREILAAGRPFDTPIAVIQWGTYQHQQVFTGTLGEIAELSTHREAGQGDFLHIEPPALAVIGNVVSLAHTLHWFGRPELRMQLRDLAAPARAGAEP